jgi:cell division septal protein FtsQ
MSASITPDTAEAHARRWREWQLKNEHTQRKGARRARLVFTAIFLVLGLGLGIQLVFSQPG